MDLGSPITPRENYIGRETILMVKLMVYLRYIGLMESYGLREIMSMERCMDYLSLIMPMAI
jgi:hypothetical protein